MIEIKSDKAQVGSFEEMENTANRIPEKTAGLLNSNRKIKSSRDNLPNKKPRIYADETQTIPKTTDNVEISTYNTNGFCMKISPSTKKTKEKVKFDHEMNQILRIPPKSPESDNDIESQFDPNFKSKMRQADLFIEQEKQKEIQLKKFEEENLRYRDCLVAELNESEIREMFQRNLPYLKNIWSGKETSDRKKMFLPGRGSKQMHFMITDPFTNEHLDWTLEEISKVWMRNPREMNENNEFIWKVILPETFIKFYMDHFSVGKEEAEKRIQNTPIIDDN